MNYVGLIGTNGSGKTLVCRYLESKGYIVFSLSDIIRDEADKKGLAHTRDNLVATSNELKAKQGLDVLAQLVVCKAQASGHDKVVLDSIRNADEVVYLKAHGTVLIGLTADVRARYDRIAKRNRSSDQIDFETFVSHDERENTGKSSGQNIQAALAQCHSIIENNGSLEELHQKIDAMLQIQSLIEALRLEIENGKERAYLVVEQEKLHTFWNMGKHIKEHLLHHSDRADYGADLFSVLAENLHIHRRKLYLYVQFFESYPQILSAPTKLTWTHFRMLLTIPEKETREEYENRIISENLSTRELEKIIKKDPISSKISTPEIMPKLTITRELPYLYELKEKHDLLLVDLGFNFFIRSPFQDMQKDTVIKVEKENDQYRFEPFAEPKTTHYTYKAYVVEILDGDTIWVDIDLGFNAWTVQKLRFRGINTEGIKTPDGKAAKDYITSQLKPCQFIAVKTYWRDKFTRYLADIFYAPKEIDFYTLVQNGKFLNQELLDKKLAVKY